MQPGIKNYVAMAWMPSALPALIASLGLAAPLHADIPDDYASIIGTTGGTVSDGYGSPGSIPVHGRAAFPVLMDSNQVPMLSAGRYGHGISPTAGRAVAAGHTGFFNTSPTPGTTRTLFINAVEWAGNETPRSAITVGSVNSGIRSFLQGQGFSVKALSTGMTNNSNNLNGVDVLVVNPHGENFTSAALTQIATFAQNGGGIVLACTPWALQEARFNAWQDILDPYGLSLSGSIVSGASFTVSPSSHPVIHSALPGLDALLADATGGPTMSLANKRIAAASVDRVLAVRSGHPELTDALNDLEVPYGIINVTPTANLNRNNSPVEAMLARFQSSRFDSMSASDLFVHPSAEGWPGLPADTAPTVTRTFTVDGNVPPDSFINWGHRGRRIDTRLYAAPGAPLTVTIPPHLVDAGLTLDIGCHIDVNFHLSNWRRFPKVTRSVPLDQAVVETGNVFGGLVWISIPTGASLGSFDVTIEGALEAPSFQLGVDTDEDWNETLKHHPGAWGVIMTENVPEYGNTPLFTIYVSRRHLQNVASAEAVALHWKDVMETADHYMGYTAHRRRGESALSDIDIVAGGGHAGWPVMMAYGDSDSLVNNTVQNGDWGFYHEIGHTYQDSFERAYVIATHGEVCVNLVPALLYTHIHDRTCWDGNVHSTFNGQRRLNDRAAFLALPTSQQTWAEACNSRPMAYDFYFNLAEAFGWDMYHEALGRLIGWHRGNADPALDLTGSRTNFNQQNKRDRTYIIFSDATGRNLDTYFQRYGLGTPGLGFEISNTARNHIAAKGYPVWIDSTPVEGIADPGAVTAVDSLPVGTALATLEAIDPTEPGTIWDWEILSGGNGRVVIDRRSGTLRVGPLGLDGITSPTQNLTVRARETTVPRYDTQRTLTVNVTPVPKAPRAASYDVLHATNSTPQNTILGTVLTTDAGRSLVSTQILSGNPNENAFGIDLQGRIFVQTPASIPPASVVTLTVSGTDDAGATGTAAVRILCNASRGLREQRWTGQTAYWDQDWSATPSFNGLINTSTTSQNVGDNYSRRITGWVIAPQTGYYTFWVASDDDSRLFLGTSSSPHSRIQRAHLSGWTSFQNFDANSSQRSAPLYLVAGQAYWLEAHQREGAGADHLSVAWSKPDGSARQIIPTQHLIPNLAGVSGEAAFPLAPVFSNLSITLPGAPGGEAYSGSLAGTATHPNQTALTFSAVSGPAWLTVAADGAVSGFPSLADAGTNQWTIRVTGDDGLWAESTLTIVVSAGDPFVQLTAPAPGQTFVADTPLTLSAVADAGDHTIQRVDFVIDDEVVGSVSEAPFSTSWTPTQTGPATATARLVHTAGEADSAPAEIWITNGHPAFINPEGGSWNHNGNWLLETIASGAGVSADFSLIELEEQTSVTLDGSRTLGGLRFGDQGGAHFWELVPGSGGEITLENSGTPTLHADSPGADVSVPLAGNQGFTKTGDGHLALTAGGNWSGSTTIAQGILEVQAKGGDVPYLVEPGASLIFGYNSGTGYSPSVTVRGDGLDSPSGLFVSADRTLASNDGIRLEHAPSRVRVHGDGTAAIRGFDVNSPHHLRVAAEASGSIIESGISVDTGWYGYRIHTEAGANTADGDVEIRGPVEGGGNANIGMTNISTSLLKTGPGSLLLTGQSTFSAGTSITEGTVILAGGDDRLPPTSQLSLGSGTHSGTLQLGDATGPVRQTFTDLLTNGSGTDNAIIGGHTELSELTLNLTEDRTFTGRLGGPGSHADNLALTKSGPATLTLTITHSHAGPTTIDEGTLHLDGTLENSPLTVTANATLTGNGSALNGVELHGSFAPSGSFTIGGTMTVAPDALVTIHIAEWDGTPGDAHDQLLAGSLTLDSTPAAPLHIVITGTATPEGFGGESRDFPIIRTTGGISGFDPTAVDIVGTALSGLEGSWSAAVVGNDLVARYQVPSQPPTLVFEPDPGVAFAAESANTFDLSGFATAGDPGDNLTFSMQSGASWIGVSETGTLSGTPPLTAAGSHAVLVRATGSSGLYAEATLNVSVTLTPHQQWRVDSFGADAADPDVAGDLADPDGDGIPNLMEFALGLSPTKPGSIHPAVATETREIDGQDWLTLVIHRNPDAAELEFAAEGTDDLADPASWDTAHTEILEDTPERLVVRDTAGGMRRFLRLRVIRPGGE